MTTNTDAFTCSVCQKLYTNPVVHQSCGFSFDRQCITNRCPAQQCGQVINEDDLVINYDLLKVVDEYRFKLETPCAYYLILLDTSTSMWYSDTWLPFAIGESRFTYALQFLNDFFTLNLNSMTDKISLVTFDTATLQRFDFETMNRTHLEMLQNLTCEGKDTALFDSIDFCLNKCEELKAALKHAMPNLYLLILTDGSNNFGKKESIHAIQVSSRSRRLHISGHMIQIGDKNRKTTKLICDVLRYKFNHFNNGNKLELDYPEHFSTRTSVTQPAVDSIANIIDQLPSVPTTPIKILSKEKVLA